MEKSSSNDKKSDDAEVTLDKHSGLKLKSETFFDSDEDDDFFDIDCDLCHKQFSCVKAYEQHLNSKKHYKMANKKKLMQKLTKTDGSNSETHCDAPEDSEEEISCDICSKSFSGYIPYNAHLKSNTHFKNVRAQRLREDMKDLPEVIGPSDPGHEDEDTLQKPFARCSPCGKVFHDPKSFKNHLAGAMHKKKMFEEKTIESLKNKGLQSPDGDDDDQRLYSTCDVCNKSFSGPVPFKMHLESAVHLKEVNRAKLADEIKDFFTKDPESQTLICKQCKKPFTDPFALKLHLESNSHEKQKNKDKVFNVVSEHPEVVVVKSIQNHTSDEESEEYHVGSYFFVCKLCHASFTGPESVQDHVKSRRHLQAKTARAAKRSLQERKDKKMSNDGNESISNDGNKSTITNGGKESISNGNKSVIANGENVSISNGDKSATINELQHGNNTATGKRPDSSDDFELI